MAVLQGDTAEARALLREALALCAPRGEKRLIIECLESLAEIAAIETRAEVAARLLGAADLLRQATGFQAMTEQRGAALALVRAALDEPAFNVAWRAGQALTWQQAVEYALGDDT